MISENCGGGEYYSNQIIRRFSDGFHDFTTLCLHRDPKFRPSPAQLLTHPFLKVSRRGLLLPDLLKPAIPLSDRVAQNTGMYVVNVDCEILTNDISDEMANFDSIYNISTMDLNSYEWDFWNKWKYNVKYYILLKMVTQQ